MNGKKRQRYPLSIYLLKKYFAQMFFTALFLTTTGCRLPYPFLSKGDMYYPPYQKLTPLQMQQREYVLNNKNIDSRTKNAIISGTIFKGMTTNEVLASWGEPATRSNAKIPQGRISQWIYDSGDYLYFLNGKLYENKKTDL